MYCALHASRLIAFLFFFNDTATTEIYTLSLHDALPILHAGLDQRGGGRIPVAQRLRRRQRQPEQRSEEHTSELQSQSNLVCRLLLEKKKPRSQLSLSHLSWTDSHGPESPWSNHDYLTLR